MPDYDALRAIAAVGMRRADAAVALRMSEAEFAACILHDDRFRRAWTEGEAQCREKLASLMRTHGVRRPRVPKQKQSIAHEEPVKSIALCVKHGASAESVAETLGVDTGELCAIFDEDAELRRIWGSGAAARRALLKSKATKFMIARLTVDELARLKKIAADRGLTCKAAAREALRNYIAAHT